jgi:hypothetical protein
MLKSRVPLDTDSVLTVKDKEIIIGVVDADGDVSMTILLTRYVITAV